jgi:hypothetical protein
MNLDKFYFRVFITVQSPNPSEFKTVPGLNYLNTIPWRCTGAWGHSSTHFSPQHFMLQLFYPQGKKAQYSLDRRLHRPHS